MPSSSHDTPESGVPPRVRFCRLAAEAVMLVMACLAPWAFGAVEAWAEFALDLGVAAIAVLGFVAGRGGGSARRSGAWPDAPSLVLIGMALLALAQGLPLRESLLSVVSPATTRLRAEVLPKSPERVLTDTSAPVPLPPPTIAQDPEAAFRAAMRLAAAWLLFQGVLGLEPGTGALRRFAGATAVNATLMAVFSLIQLLAWNGKIYWVRPSPGPSSGPFVSHSHLAAYLNLGLGFVVATLLTRDRSSRAGNGVQPQLWTAYAAGLLVIAIVASKSRNGVVSMAVAFLIAVILLRPRLRQLAAGLALVGVLGTLLLVVVGESSSYGDRIATLMGSAAYYDRVGIWVTGLKVWLSYPLWGTGLGSFAVATMPVMQQNLHAENGYFGHAENEYLEWLVEGGVVGLALFLVLIIAVARHAWRALGAARSVNDRALIVGAIYGGVAICVDGFGDFALHIPGVAVSVAILAAHLTKLGLEARASETPAAEPAEQDISAWFGRLTAPILGVMIVVSGLNLARSEAAYRASGRAWPGLGATAAVYGPDDLPRLRRERAAVAAALELRPNWSEGYQELGLVLLGLYEAKNQELLSAVEKDPAARASASRPIAFHALVHAPTQSTAWTAEDVEARPAMRAYLVPAVRAFLRARQYCPFRPLVALELASLDGLLQGADPAPVLIERGVRLAGGNAAPLGLAAQLANQIGDDALLAQIERKQLSFVDADWIPVADAAAGALSPDDILARVVPDGRYAVLFAERLYHAPGDRAVRERFLHEALRRLPNDSKLSPAARHHLEARALRGLGDRDKAREAMELALSYAPRQTGWRRELVDWLIGWGQAEEAHGQALVGVGLAPGDPEARKTLEIAVDALARQAPSARGNR